MDENEKGVHEMREIRNERLLSFLRSSKSPGGSDSMLLEQREEGKKDVENEVRELSIHVERDSLDL